MEEIVVSRVIPVIYRNMKYPAHIKASIHEVSGNFCMKKELHVNFPYSLHTESSFEQRTFGSKFVNGLEHIKKAQINGIPQLWRNKEWADEFFTFVERLINSNKPPDVLEIHPPYMDYCDSFNHFLKTFKVFYDKFELKYPKTKIFIENRYGTRYKDKNKKPGKFILSTCSDILEFCKILGKKNINLKIALDYPQIFSAEINDDGLKWNDIALEKKKILSFNKDLEKYREQIGGIHMWGKLRSKDGKRWKAHAGNFDTFFCKNKELKNEFLKSVFSTFNDGKDRYFVPEIISGTNDLHSIVKDMKNEYFIFI